MKKILLIAFVIIVTSLSLHINAQTNAQPAETVPRTNDIDLQSKVDNLTAQVDSLSHELLYLNLSYEVYTLNTDFEIFKLNIQETISGIRLDISNNKKLDRDFYWSHKRLYNAYKENLDARKRLRNVKQKFFSFKSAANDLTYNEKDNLNDYYSISENLIEQVEILLDTMKELLDIYYDNL